MSQGLNPASSAKSTVLVVDDEASICWAFEKMLKGEGYQAYTASSAEDGLRLAASIKPSLVFLDVRLPKEDGLTALPKFRSVTDNAPVIVMTAFGDLETAVTAVSRGAADYITKPFKLEDVLAKCRQVLSHGPKGAYVAIRRSDDFKPTLVGRSVAIQAAFRQIALVAASDLSVLITGETGTGKELVAMAIHQHSLRKESPYFPIAPVTLNPDLIESELFGHIKGAFTGATDDKIGLFEKAEGGTVLLDEIGELPLGTQAKLLRVLEQGDYFRVGDVRPRRCDVRILAATNRDLRQLVREGSFREDLYYRLNGLHIHLPPLRERGEDIGLLCQYFLNAIGYPNAEQAVGKELLELLQQRKWRGNIRELRNAIEHAAVVARGRALVISDFPAEEEGGEQAPDSPSDLQSLLEELLRKLMGTDEIGAKGLQQAFLDRLEPTLLRFAMTQCGGNRVKAAELLGIHRGTLRERLRYYELDDN